ncbi:MAG TPA: hypothetical protein VFE22_09560 [Edaphobacter sp.]|nr:hypothetical protein [Edaphobacter sp.]
MAMFGHPRIYPNLNPSAAVPVDRDQIFQLRNFADIYRMSRGKEHAQYVPNARFTFVKLTSGETLMHQRFRHPALAEGRPVLYAGEAHFDNGRLRWWSNGSGNYRPDPDHAAQAGLPVEQFFTHDEILRGKHTQADVQPISQPVTALPSLQAKLATGRVLNRMTVRRSFLTP